MHPRWYHSERDIRSSQWSLQLQPQPQLERPTHERCVRAASVCAGPSSLRRCWATLTELHLPPFSSTFAHFCCYRGLSARWPKRKPGIVTRGSSRMETPRQRPRRGRMFLTTRIKRKTVPNLRWGWCGEISYWCACYTSVRVMDWLSFLPHLL